MSAFSSEFCKAHSPTSEFCKAHSPTSECCNKAQAPTFERSEAEVLGALSSERCEAEVLGALSSEHCEVKASASECCADELPSECCEVETQGAFSSECHDNELKAPASESRDAAGAVGMHFNESCEVQAWPTSKCCRIEALSAVSFERCEVQVVPDASSSECREAEAVDPICSEC